MTPKYVFKRKPILPFKREPLSLVFGREEIDPVFARDPADKVFPRAEPRQFFTRPNRPPDGRLQDTPKNHSTGINVSHNPNLDPGTDRLFTVSFWFKSTEWEVNYYPYFINKGSPYNSPRTGWEILHFRFTTFHFISWKVYQNGATAECQFSGDVIHSGNWHHVTASMDINNLYLFFDDALAQQTPHTLTDVGTTDILNISGNTYDIPNEPEKQGPGAEPWSDFWGELKDIRLWKGFTADLAAATKLYKNDYSGLPPLTAFWPLDGNLLDYTNNGHDGTEEIGPQQPNGIEYMS